MGAVAPLVHLTPLDAAYPARLRAIEDPPASITVQGDPVHASLAVAIVGSRAATPEAAAFARELAGVLAGAGVVVVSGGAEGIDAAAHEGALAAGGRTWAVAGTGHRRCFPATHADLFEAIARGPGAMVWPFAPDYRHRTGFLSRNRILAALADALVVVQAGFPSGALHAAECARKLDKAVWAVPAAPWMDEFTGSRWLLDEGARPLTSIEGLLGSLGVETARAEVRPGPESEVLAALSTAPLHLDVICGRAKLSPQAVAAALLTLALENVVVESPPGFFCRRNAHNC
jgi:DNA processing protein